MLWARVHKLFSENDLEQFDWDSEMDYDCLFERIVARELDRIKQPVSVSLARRSSLAQVRPLVTQLGIGPDPIAEQK